MADVKAVRDFLLNKMGEPGAPSSPNSIHRRLEAFHAGDGGPPATRNRIYEWFGEAGSTRKNPTALLLECIPAFADMFRVPAIELYRTAGLVPRELETTISLATAAHDFRQAFRLASKTLASAGLSSAGEALVVDRLLHAKLDFKVTTWPVVRGHRHPLHYHSWITLDPIESPTGRTRERTQHLLSLTIDEQRRRIRHDYIGEDVWRALGLRWRYLMDHDRTGQHCLEVAVQERNRRPLRPMRQQGFAARRILVLAPRYAHAELLGSLIADGLGLGSNDLRYQGFESIDDRADCIRFSTRELRHGDDDFVFPIVGDDGLFDALRPAIIEAAKDSIIVWMTYGPTMRRAAAKTWRSSIANLNRAERSIKDIVETINRTQPVIHCSLSDSDIANPLLPVGIDRDAIADQIRYSALETLNCLHRSFGGPSAMRWSNDRFADLLLPMGQLDVPDRASTVDVLPITGKQGT